MGLVGVEMVGRRGEPSMLLIKVEKPKPDFFLPPSDFLFLEVPSPSPLKRWRGLFVPPESLRGGVSMVLLDLERERVKDADWRSFGDLVGAAVVKGVVVEWACCGGEGRRRVMGGLIVARMPDESNGDPKAGWPTSEWLEGLGCEGGAEISPKRWWWWLLRVVFWLWLWSWMGSSEGWCRNEGDLEGWPEWLSTADEETVEGVLEELKVG
jgi:hypothetical protein